MEDKEREVEAFLNRPTLVLDLANLSDAQRSEGSMFLGGSAAEFVRSEDDFDMQGVTEVVFNWGDPKAGDVFAQLIEHTEPPSHIVFPFQASAIIADNIWSLAVQDREFHPAQAYKNEDDYILLSDDPAKAAAQITGVIDQAPTHIQILGRVGSRYVLFEMGTNINPILEE